MSIQLKNHYQFVILGAGLSGSLMALKLIENNIHDFIVIEKDNTLNLNNHTWSFFKNDVSSNQFEFLKKIGIISWPKYSLYFSNNQQIYNQTYCTLIGSNLEKYFLNQVSELQILFNTQPLVDSSQNALVLDGKTKIIYTYLIDARGENTNKEEQKNLGYQKFLGLELSFAEPHKLENPILIDARINQTDGFRFFYILPLNENTLLVEDTRYNDNSNLNLPEIENEIIQYANINFNNQYSIKRKEKGVLSLPCEAKNILENTSTFTIGARAGFIHPVTGYSLFLAIQTVEFLAKALIDNSRISSEKYKQFKKNTQKRLWLFYKLNFVLFKVASAEERLKLFQYCYSRPNWIIKKFYAARFNYFDTIIFFLGLPPVSILKLIKIWYKNCYAKKT